MQQRRYTGKTTTKRFDRSIFLFGRPILSAHRTAFVPKSNPTAKYLFKARFAAAQPPRVGTYPWNFIPREHKVSLSACSIFTHYVLHNTKVYDSLKVANKLKIDNAQQSRGGGAVLRRANKTSFRNASLNSMYEWTPAINEIHRSRTRPRRCTPQNDMCFSTGHFICIDRPLAASSFYRWYDSINIRLAKAHLLLALGLQCRLRRGAFTFEILRSNHGECLLMKRERFLRRARTRERGYIFRERFAGWKRNKKNYVCGWKAGRARGGFLLTTAARC